MMTAQACDIRCIAQPQLSQPLAGGLCGGGEAAPVPAEHGGPGAGTGRPTRRQQGPRQKQQQCALR